MLWPQEWTHRCGPAKTTASSRTRSAKAPFLQVIWLVQPAWKRGAKISPFLPEGLGFKKQLILSSDSKRGTKVQFCKSVGVPLTSSGLDGSKETARDAEHQREQVRRAWKLWYTQTLVRQEHKVCIYKYHYARSTKEVALFKLSKRKDKRVSREIFTQLPFVQRPALSAVGAETARLCPPSRGLCAPWPESSPPQPEVGPPGKAGDCDDDKQEAEGGTPERAGTGWRTQMDVLSARIR